MSIPMVTIFQDFPPPKPETPVPKIQPKPKPEIIYILPKTDWSKIRKIALLVYILGSLTFYPPLLFGILLWAISGFMLVNSPNQFAKKIERKEITIIENLEIETPKIIEISQNTPPSLPPTGVDTLPEKVPEKENLAEIYKKAKSQGNEKLANKIANFQNVLKNIGQQIDLDKINLF